LATDRCYRPIRSWIHQNGFGINLTDELVKAKLRQTLILMTLFWHRMALRCWCTSKGKISSVSTDSRVSAKANLVGRSSQNKKIVSHVNRRVRWLGSMYIFARPDHEETGTRTRYSVYVLWDSTPNGLSTRCGFINPDNRTAKR